MNYSDILLAEAISGGGGGETVLINKNISANGTYNASSDSADGYKKVVVSVPNTYSAGDEGKVVSSGALVSQTSATYTSNNTYDTTLINSVTVNVPPINIADELAKGNPTGAITITETSVVSNAFREKTGITSVYAPNVTTMYGSAFMGCTGLLSADFPELTVINSNTFENCTSLASAIFQKATTIYGSAFKNATGKLAFPSLTSVQMNGFSTFKGKEIDFGSGYSNMDNYTFNGMQSSFPLDTIVLRRSQSVVSLMGYAGVGGQFSSGQSGGKVYIPKALYDHLNDGTSLDYMTSTNWVNLMSGNANNSFECIEGSCYETHYADGTPIS